MIGISRLYCGHLETGDSLRYGNGTAVKGTGAAGRSWERRPVVVWNVTKKCNLNCVHCYSDSGAKPDASELTTDEGLALIDGLASFGCPVVLFSGGEPLIRGDIMELIGHASAKGIRTVVSTNGTLIDAAMARNLKLAGVSYVGVSLDGSRPVHDAMRVRPGAFDAAIAGISACKSAGLRTGIRFTMTKKNAADIEKMFGLVETLRLPRICFYHLVYAGRGKQQMKEALSHEESRRSVNLIIERTARLHEAGNKVEVLTVDNHSDGPFLYLRMKAEKNPRAEEVMGLLRMSGGNSSGVGIGCIGWDGSVFPDQFWRHYSLGNVRKRPFAEVWTDKSEPLLSRLKEKKAHVKGRCTRCRFIESCAGNFRVRAEAVHGDAWQPDPACYLTDGEIAAG